MSEFKSTIKRMISVYETSTFLKIKDNTLKEKISKDLVFLFICFIFSNFMIVNSLFNLFKLVETVNVGLNFFILGTGIAIFSSSIFIYKDYFEEYYLNKIFQNIFNFFIKKPYFVIKKKWFIKNKLSLEKAMVRDYKDIVSWFNKINSDKLEVLISELSFPQKDTTVYDMSSLKIELSKSLFSEDGKHCDFLSHEEIKELANIASMKENIRFFTKD